MSVALRITACVVLDFWADLSMANVLAWTEKGRHERCERPVTLHRLTALALLRSTCYGHPLLYCK